MKRGSKMEKETKLVVPVTIEWIEGTSDMYGLICIECGGVLDLLNAQGVQSDILAPAICRECKRPHRVTLIPADVEIVITEDLEALEEMEK